MTIVLHNNEFITEKTKVTPIKSKSFQYGLGAFQTLRSYQQKLIHPEIYIANLKKSAEILNLKFNEKEAWDGLKRVIRKSKSDSRIKLIITEEGLTITATKLNIDKNIYKGIALKSVKASRFLPEIKSTSYLSSYITHSKAVTENFFDALLVNELNEVKEGAYSNIFWQEEDKICTTNKKIYKGTTRKIILKLRKVNFKEISLKKLKTKKNIFISQSTTGILPVTKIDKINIKLDQRSFQKLKSEFDQYLKINLKSLV